jgi:DNA-binding response OmpR family regulator
VIRPETPGKQILLAEDEPEMRALLAQRLRARGHKVIEAPDGTHLCAAIDDMLVGGTRWTPIVDLVITDVRMPGCTGIDVLAWLRRRGWPTPVILITAFGDDALHAEARRLGAFAVFDKPFDLDDLCTAIVNIQHAT